MRCGEPDAVDHTHSRNTAPDINSISANYSCSLIHGKTSDCALMRSGISVIARRSHERRVNPPGRQWSSVRGDASAEVRGRSGHFLPLLYLHPGPILILSQHSDEPRVLRDPLVFPLWLFLRFHGSSPEPFVGTVYPPVLQLREGMLI